MEVSGLLGLSGWNADPAMFPGVDRLCDDDRGRSPECQVKHLHFWQETVQRIDPVISIAILHI